jgi:hypothetical protein
MNLSAGFRLLRECATADVRPAAKVSLRDGNPNSGLMTRALATLGIRRAGGSECSTRSH